MKYIWEISDIIAGRQFTDKNNTTTGTLMIGYDPPQEREAKWNLIALSDGCLYTKYKSRKEIVEILNAMEAIPLNIILPKGDNK